MKSIEGILKIATARSRRCFYALYQKHGLMELQAKSVRKHSGNFGMA